jgi:hypothetical protein
MVTYQVNNETCNNLYLALHKSWKTGKDIKFYCYDYEFDQHDWSVEPIESMDFLMATHAHNLRQRYERLILLWSGGTDSHTIYNVFKENRIHLDEIIIKADTTEGSIFPEENHIWLRNNHWDPTTIITRYDNHDMFIREKDIPDEDWVWRDKGDLLKYGNTSSGDGVRFLCEKNHAGTRYCAIGGYEKPRLVYRAGRWYHRQMDQPLHPTMGHNYIEHFFFEPLIAIKQAHMVKHAVKQLIETRKLPLYDGDWAEAKWERDVVGYRAWATACGRHDELYIGVSNRQKHYNDILHKTLIRTTGNWRDMGLDHTADRRLAHDLANGSRVATNYVRGLHNLHSESGFVDYLREKNYFRENNDRCFTSLRFTWSKEYDLGE